MNKRVQFSVAKVQTAITTATAMVTATTQQQK